VNLKKEQEIEGYKKCKHWWRYYPGTIRGCWMCVFCGVPEDEWEKNKPTRGKKK